MELLKKYFYLILIIVIFLLQIPFLNADPDTLVDINTRGAWTDEGHWSSQIRNYVNHGYIAINESTQLVRSPFYSLLLIPFYYLFGTNLIVCRLVTLLFTLFVILLFLSNNRLRNFGIFLSLFVLLEFHIFQFSHYGMPEVICIDFILLSLFFIIKSIEQENNNNKIIMLFYSCFFLFLSYSSKIQFLYVAAIIPVTAFFISLNKSLINKRYEIKHYSFFLWSVLFTTIFSAVYFFLWFLPNKEFYLYVMSNESLGKYADTRNELWTVFSYNYKHVLWLKGLKIFFSHFYIILIASIIFFIVKRRKAIHSVIAIFSFVWILLELHKIPMYYLPNRYLISLFFATGVFISAFYSELSVYLKKIKYIFYTIALIFGIYNMTYYTDALKRRTYQLATVNEYLSKYDLKNNTVIGSWAPSVCWKNKAITLPVWNNYMNWENPVEKLKPNVIVSEIDESDSDCAYKKQGIDLAKISDSCRIFDMWRYKLALYWLNNKY